MLAERAAEMLAERAAGAGLEHTPSTVPVPVLRSHSLHGSGKTVQKQWLGPHCGLVRRLLSGHDLLAASDSTVSEMLRGRAPSSH